MKLERVEGLAKSTCRKNASGRGMLEQRPRGGPATFVKQQGAPCRSQEGSGEALGRGVRGWTAGVGKTGFLSERQGH